MIRWWNMCKLNRYVKESSKMAIDMANMTVTTNLTKLYVESHVRVNYKVVELEMDFVTIPNSAKMEFGWRKHRRISTALS